MNKNEIFISSIGDLVIRAMVAAENGKFRRITFDKSEVAYVAKTGDTASALVLKSGIIIPVSLLAEDLERKVYFPHAKDGPLLDLTGLTGMNTVQTAEHLSNIFANAAEKKETGLTMTVLARKRYNNDRTLFKISGENIAWENIEQLDTDRNKFGVCIAVPLKGVKDPFGEENMILDLPHTQFRDMYTAALNARKNRLTLPDAAAYIAQHMQVDFTVFVKQPNQQNYQIFHLQEQDADWGKTKEVDGQNGNATRISLKNKKKSPFGEDYIILDMPHAKFMEIYKNAKMEGVPGIDLREQTRGQGVGTKHPPSPSAPG